MTFLGLNSYLTAFSSFVFWIVMAIHASGTQSINLPILVGLVVTGCLPTTIISNVVMTREAKGNDSVPYEEANLADHQATLIEATIGHVPRPFLSPALTRIYLTPLSALVPGTKWGGQLYIHVFKQLGCTAFAPLLLDQLIQINFATQSTRGLSKVGGFCVICSYGRYFLHALLPRSS